jgi:hypothetical protein
VSRCPREQASQKLTHKQKKDLYVVAFAIERYRWRAGIEASMSEYATLTGVKRLSVHGMVVVRYCSGLKAATLNLMRAVRVQRARIKARSRAAAALSQASRVHFMFLKERLVGLIGDWDGFSLPGQAQLWMVLSKFDLSPSVI